MTARDDILARIHAALAEPGAGTRGAGQPDAAGIPRTYRTHGTTDPAGLAELFASRLTDYKAILTTVTTAALPAAVAQALSRHGARRIVIPPGLDLPGWPQAPQPAGRSPFPAPAGLPEDAEVTVDDATPARDLDTYDAVVTGAALAIASTGTIVLDGSPGQGRRAVTLIPDLHLCILHASQIVAGVPEAIARLRPARPLTWISGPSATSDIELDRVEGVHGPRTLHVLLVTPAADPG